MKISKNEKFEIIRLDGVTDEVELLATFETKEEALAFGEKLAENITDEYILSCVSNHIIGEGYESCRIYEVWDTISDQIIQELEQEEM